MILAFRSCLAIRQTLSPDVGAIRSGMKFMFVAEGGDRDVSKINQTEVSAEAAMVSGALHHCFLGQERPKLVCY